MLLITFSLFMSITVIVLSFRFGLASTVEPRYPNVMPEPRCGMPAIGSSAVRHNLAAQLHAVSDEIQRRSRRGAAAPDRP